jgi:hypothetical protein
MRSDEIGRYRTHFTTEAYAFRARIIKEGDLGLDFYDPLIEALKGGSPDCGLCVILGLLD